MLSQPLVIARKELTDHGRDRSGVIDLVPDDQLPASEAFGEGSAWLAGLS
jgi:hypothetical protein